VRAGRLAAAGLVGLLSGSLLCAPAAAQSSAPGLAISAPSAVSLGSAPVGQRTLAADLGSVRVTTSAALLGSGAWTATVSTTGFRTGGGTPAERVPASAVAYRSGAATASSGLSLSACTAGQLVAAVDLSTPRTAFSCSGFSLLSSTSVTWNPRITVTISDQNVVGGYSGTIVHSVA